MLLQKKALILSTENDMQRGHYDVEQRHKTAIKQLQYRYKKNFAAPQQTLKVNVSARQALDFTFKNVKSGVFIKYSKQHFNQPIYIPIASIRQASPYLFTRPIPPFKRFQSIYCFATETFSYRPGCTPPTIVYGGTSFVTTARAAMIAPLPMRTPAIITAS